MDGDKGIAYNTLPFDPLKYQGENILGTIYEKYATFLTLDIKRLVVPAQARKKIL